MPNLLEVNETYIVLINSILRPLGNSELIYFEENLLAGAVQLRWAEGKVCRKEVLPSVSINIEMSEVEWLHCYERSQMNESDV